VTGVGGIAWAILDQARQRLGRHEALHPLAVLFKNGGLDAQLEGDVFDHLRKIGENRVVDGGEPHHLGHHVQDGAAAQSGVQHRHTHLPLAVHGVGHPHQAKREPFQAFGAVDDACLLQDVVDALDDGLADFFVVVPKSLDAVRQGQSRTRSSPGARAWLPDTHHTPARREGPSRCPRTPGPPALRKDLAQGRIVRSFRHPFGMKIKNERKNERKIEKLEAVCLDLFFILLFLSFFVFFFFLLFFFLQGFPISFIILLLFYYFVNSLRRRSLLRRCRRRSGATGLQMPVYIADGAVHACPLRAFRADLVPVTAEPVNVAV
jgi:hypothetical protein